MLSPASVNFPLHMNFNLKQLPDRTAKPRKTGLTMVMDKGLSLNGARDMIENAGSLTDLVKLGFGTAVITGKLREKLDLYRMAGIPTYFGGTLLEAFIVRGQFDDYLKILDEYQMKFCEVSDGCLEMDHDEKCRY